MHLPFSHERRRPTRPSTGDTATCAKCERGSMEFNERTRDAATGVTLPAWSCDSCGAVVWVRSVPPTHAGVRSASKMLRAKSMRKLMKSRTARLKAQGVLNRALARKKPKAS